jgi:uncharacterized phage-associated protein
MYEARKVCNFLLARYDAQRFALTNLRLNKLHERRRFAD